MTQDASRKKEEEEGATEEEDFAFNGRGLHADSMIVLRGREGGRERRDR
jgi:hypothetical protein